jgi:hypothetical protein
MFHRPLPPLCGLGLNIEMALDSTETGLESVYTDTGGDTTVERTECLYCHLIIEKPRKGKRFCNNKHRWLYHNVYKKDELKAFAEEINDLLEKHGLLRKCSPGKET